MSPTYSVKSFRALAYLKSSANDAVIYVEDSSIRNVYNILIKSILPGTARFTGVTPVGSKEKVLELCKSDQENDKKKRLYVVDGDLELIAGKRLPKLAYLYRLPCYSIENMLVSDSAVNRLGLHCLPGRPEDEVIRELNWSYELQRFANQFGSLFILYAIAQTKLKNNRPETVSTAVFSLCKRGPRGEFLPCNQKIMAKCKALMKLLHQRLSVHSVRKIRKQYLARIEKSKLGWANFIAGKDYLLRFLSHYLDKKTGFRCSQNQLSTFLATFSVGNIDQGLKKQILNVFS